jgi:hypothetical protein
MAIVKNLARPSEAADVPYTTPNRAATIASTPLYAGEIIYDTALKLCYVALSVNPPMWGAYNYGWQQM